MKRYSGYTSFSFLEEGKDYRRFELAAATDRVPSRPVEVPAEQEAHVQALMRDNVVISLHEHPTLVPKDVSQIFEYRRQNRDRTGYAGLSISGLDAVFDNLN